MSDCAADSAGEGLNQSDNIRLEDDHANHKS